MKTIRLCLALLAIGNAFGGEEMTAKRFKELVAAPGDHQALRAELADLPLWKKAMSSLSMKYRDGKVFKEDCLVTSKVIGGNYVVLAIESKFYKQTMHTIVGYDENAHAIRQWGLFGETLTEATMIVDPVSKVTASVARYGDGFEEITAATFSAKETSGRTVVYKNGVHFMTREATTRPVEDEANKEK